MVSNMVRSTEVGMGVSQSPESNSTSYPHTLLYINIMIKDVLGCKRFFDCVS